MRLLKRHSCPIGDLHKTPKQCQCVSCSVEADTLHQVRHHNVPTYLSFFLHLPFILLSFLLFLSFLFLPVLCTFLQLPLSPLVSFPIMKIAPSIRAKHNMYADGSDIQTPSNDENSVNTKTVRCKPRNALPHTVPVNIPEPTWVTSSIEPTINVNVLPLTSTAELSFTQALTYLAINRKHQIYCSTQQVTSSQGHAMAREHQRRYSHHSCWCHQPAYTDTADRTPLRSQLRTAKSNWQKAMPASRNTYTSKHAPY